MESPLAGRVCVVTGANRGIGKAIARGLAALGATVVLACRRPEAGAAAKAEIARGTGNADLAVMPLDLADFASVRGFASQVTAAFPRIHVLVNNAGIYAARRELTVDGFERTWQVDYLSHFLLTNLLLDALRAGAPARVINVSSEGHRLGRIDFADLNGARRYRGLRAYGQAKLAQILFAREFARRFAGTGVAAYAMHPGGVRAGWSRGGRAMRVGALLAWPFLRTPEEGADTAVWLASAPLEGAWNGRYFIDRRPARPKADGEDDGLARRLWDESEVLSGLRTGRAPADPS